MSKKNNRNALKHGAFAKEVILPGEDLAEFEALYNSVIEEWQPVGATQHEKVENLAECLWRRRRVRRFRHKYVAKVARWLKFWEKLDDKLIESLWDLLCELESVCESGSLGVITEEELLAKLDKVGAGKVLPDSIYKSDLARRKFKTDSEWLNAVLDRFWAALECYMATVANYAKYFEHLYNEETLAKYLKLEERLDAMIDKIIKSLCQIKAMNEIISRNQNSVVADRAGSGLRRSISAVSA